MAFEIYAKQLALKKNGYALWRPDPRDKPAVQIADVGYIEKGKFIRLFNASQTPGHESNRLGVPEGYCPIQIGEIEEDILSADFPVMSENVTQLGAQLDLTGAVAGGGLSIICSNEQGAALVLGSDADVQDALCKKVFLQYIRNNYTSWLAFANQRHGRLVTLNDLVLCDKTSAWACAIFSGSSSQTSLKIAAGQTGMLQGGIDIWASWNNCQFVEGHSGPRASPQSVKVSRPAAEAISADGTNTRQSVQRVPGPTEISRDAANFTMEMESLPRDQCIFVRGFKILDRTTWRQKLRLKKQGYDGFDYFKRKGAPDGFSDGPNQPRPRDPPFGDNSNSGESGQSGYFRSVSNRGGGTEGHGRSSGERALPADASVENMVTSKLSDDILEDIDLYMQLNPEKEPTPIDLILDYILENSVAELALVHDDDLANLIESNKMENFDVWLHYLAPQIYIDDWVGMLENSYQVSLSVTKEIKSSRDSYAKESIATRAQEDRRFSTEGSLNVLSAKPLTLASKHPTTHLPGIPHASLRPHDHSPILDSFPIPTTIIDPRPDNGHNKASHNEQVAEASQRGFLKHRTNTQIIIGDDGIVKAGTIEALVERLTVEPFNIDQQNTFLRTFFITFRTFSTADRVLELLISWFGRNSPVSPTHNQLMKEKDIGLRPIQARVLHVLTLWVEKYGLAENDAALVSRLREFLNIARLSAGLKASTEQIWASPDVSREHNFELLPLVSSAPKRTNIGKPRTDLLNTDPAALGRQLTLYEARLYCKISPQECLTWSGAQEGGTMRNLVSFMSTRDNISTWVKLSVLGDDALGVRVNTIDLWISVAEKCRELNNYSSASAIVVALTSEVISPLKLTFSLVNRASRLEHLAKILELSNPATSAQLSSKFGPCLPYIGEQTYPATKIPLTSSPQTGTILSDLVQLTQTIPNFFDTRTSDRTQELSLIYFEKRQKMLNIVDLILRHQPNVRDKYNIGEITPVMQLVEDQLNIAAESDEGWFWRRSRDIQQAELAHADIQKGLKAAGF